MFYKFQIIILTALFLSCTQEKIVVDILITNGKVYNGVEEEPTTDAIGIKDDKIVFVGYPNKKIVVEAKKQIDASGWIVCPGFIDPHSHADKDLHKIDMAHNKPFLYQGITTVVVGNDGESFYPISKYRDLYELQGIGTNVVPLVGHNTIREQVMGNSDKEASVEEIIFMQGLVQKEMDAGAFGISTGLFYAPGSYSNTEEVIALAETVANNKGIYETHLRDESTYNIGLISAVKEAIQIGKEAKLPIHISHIKCLGVDVWRQSDEIVFLIEEAQRNGIKVTANQYPYNASITELKSAVIPRWAESGGIDSLFIRYNDKKFRKRILEETKKNIIRHGGANKLLILDTKETKYLGKDILEISEMLNISPEKAVFKILQSGSTKIASFNMSSYDIRLFMRQDWVVTSSDGNTGHPRKYGSFPRKYNKYVKDDKLIRLSNFIKNSTSKTAQIFKIKQRGELLKDYFADIIIFDPETFKDVADYTDAFQLSEGLKYSIINGKLIIEDGKFTKTLNGRVLDKTKM